MIETFNVRETVCRSDDVCVCVVERFWVCVNDGFDDIFGDEDQGYSSIRF